MSIVKLIHRTEDAERLIAYMARVSSPHQDNPESDKLIRYLIEHKHWSPMEMASMCIEIQTSRAIAQQILRHRSFSFQEFSQRYAKAAEFEFYSARRQDTKNRQNSIDDMSDEDENWFLSAQEQVIELSTKLYEEALSKQIAKEQARFLLPLSTTSKLYMHGNLRSWIHYLELRTEKGTQLEHREIAEKIKTIFTINFPIVAKALDWTTLPGENNESGSC